MSLKNKWKALVLLVAVLALGVVGVGCGSSDSDGSGDQPKVTLELALQSGCAFCLAIQHGAEDAAEAEHGDGRAQHRALAHGQSLEKLEKLVHRRPATALSPPGLRAACA